MRCRPSRSKSWTPIWRWRSSRRGFSATRRLWRRSRSMGRSARPSLPWPTRRTRKSIKRSPDTCRYRRSLSRRPNLTNWQSRRKHWRISEILWIKYPQAASKRLSASTKSPTNSSKKNVRHSSLKNAKKKSLNCKTTTASWNSSRILKPLRRMISINRSRNWPIRLTEPLQKRVAMVKRVETIRLRNWYHRRKEMGFFRTSTSTRSNRRSMPSKSKSRCKCTTSRSKNYTCPSSQRGKS